MDIVAEIKRKFDLPEYIGRSVQLSRAGRNLRGLCPFHGEKTPSFYVFPDRGTWRCFGACGEGGDLFSYVQKQRGIDFATAIRELAFEGGIEMSPEAGRKRSRVEHLARVVSTAVDYYERRLGADEGRDARAYLEERRGLLQTTIEAFHLGWAPDGWRGLRDHLAGRGFDEADMLAAGLLVEPDGAGREPYDRFRGRIVIPITDDRGVFIGFGGRGLHGEEPKYLNSPQTELFDKGRTLFGLDHAREAIQATGVVVVVEGYMDVLGPWQAGFRNVVATLGTSLTEHHVGILRRHARRIVLALDPDAAGIAATERAGELVLSLASPEAMARSTRATEAMSLEHGVDLRVAELPAGKDPDEVTRDHPEVWDRAIADASPFAEFALRRLLVGAAPDSGVERRQVLDRVRMVLLAVTDPVERAVYVQRVARFLGVTEASVTERLRTNQSPAARAHAAARREPPTREETLLAILLRHDHLRPSMRSLPIDLFNESINREVFLRWLREESARPEGDSDPVTMRDTFYRAMRLPPLSDDQARLAASRKVEEILRDRLIQRQATVSAEVAEAERELGAGEVAAISHDAWMGAMPADDITHLAQTVIEDLELGISIHRREFADRS